MAKGILRFFGGATILVGFLTIIVGLLTPSGQGLIITLPIGAGLLISGAPLLGFAYVIELLEQIARNTSIGQTGIAHPGTVTSALGMTAPSEPLSNDPAYSPRQGDHSVTKVVERAAYLGQDYRLHADGMVTARLSDGPYTWQDLDAFKIWLRRPSANGTS